MSKQKKMHFLIMSAAADAMGHDMFPSNEGDRHECLDCGHKGYFEVSDTAYYFSPKIQAPCGSLQMVGDKERFEKVIEAVTDAHLNRNKTKGDI